MDISCPVLCFDWEKQSFFWSVLGSWGRCYRDQDRQSNPISSKLRSQRTIRHSQLRLSEKRILSVITFYWTYRKCEFVLSLFFAIYLPCYYGDRPGSLKLTQQRHLLLCSVNHRTFVCHVTFGTNFPPCWSTRKCLPIQTQLSVFRTCRIVLCTWRIFLVLCVKHTVFVSEAKCISLWMMFCICKPHWACVWIIVRE